MHASASVIWHGANNPGEQLGAPTRDAVRKLLSRVRCDESLAAGDTSVGQPLLSSAGISPDFIQASSCMPGHWAVVQAAFSKVQPTQVCSTSPLKFTKILLERGRQKKQCQLQAQPNVELLTLKSSTLESERDRFSRGVD